MCLQDSPTNNTTSPNSIPRRQRMCHLQFTFDMLIYILFILHIILFINTYLNVIMLDNFIFIFHKRLFDKLYQMLLNKYILIYFKTLYKLYYILQSFVTSHYILSHFIVVFYTLLQIISICDIFLRFLTLY